MPRTEFFTMKSEQDGLELSLMLVRPDGEIRALVQLAHGMTEHKERYIPLMEYLASRGYVCVMNDHRGHGKSICFAEDLGFFGRGGAKHLVDDLHQLTLDLRQPLKGSARLNPGRRHFSHPGSRHQRQRTQGIKNRTQRFTRRHDQVRGTKAWRDAFG